MMHEPTAEITEPQPTPLSRELQLMAALKDGGAIIGQEGNVEVYTCTNPEEILNRLVAQNYLLHGTTRLVEGDFMPQLADDSEKESGNRTAIYMTAAPAIAMFKGLMGGINDSYTTHHGFGIEEIDGVKTYSSSFGTDRPDLVSEQGYVYVFDSLASDEYENGEYLAYSSIHPLAAIKLTRSQFNYPIETLNKVEPTQE